jgi:tetratricopeptide (TPR) repeat protein
MAKNTDPKITDPKQQAQSLSQALRAQPVISDAILDAMSRCGAPYFSTGVMELAAQELSEKAPKVAAKFIDYQLGVTPDNVALLALREELNRPKTQVQAGSGKEAADARWPDPLKAIVAAGKRKDYDVAKELCVEALKDPQMQPWKSHVLRHLAGAAYKLAKPGLEMVAREELVVESPHHAEYHLKYAMCAAQAKRLDDAQVFYEKQLEKNPRSEGMAFGYSEVFRLKHDVKRAQAICDEGLRLYPHDVMLTVQKARLHVHDGKLGAAVDVLLPAITHHIRAGEPLQPQEARESGTQGKSWLPLLEQLHEYALHGIEQETYDMVLNTTQANGLLDKDSALFGELKRDPAAPLKPVPPSLRMRTFSGVMGDSQEVTRRGADRLARIVGDGSRRL